MKGLSKEKERKYISLYDDASTWGTPRGRVMSLKENRKAKNRNNDSKT